MCTLHPTRSVATLVFLCTFVSRLPEALAQDACPGSYVGCASAPIAYHFREGLPVEVNIDTGWLPAGSPIQVRFALAFDGHTSIDLAGILQAGWPTAMALQAIGTPGGGSLAVDYGIQFDAQVRLHLPTGVSTIDWSGSIPYVPMVDFRAMASQLFDPWAWAPVTADGITARQHIADVPLTTGIIPIPGISGGLSFDAMGEVQATYQSQDITFGVTAPDITPTAPVAQADFTAGPFVEYSPRLEGTLAHTGTLHIYPGLYIALAGRMWTLDLADIPIPIGPFSASVPFAPSLAHLSLPLLSLDATDVDFGNVNVGTTATQSVYVDNHGEGDGVILGHDPADPFGLDAHASPIPTASRAGLALTFTPTVPGPAVADLSIVTNDPTNPRLMVHVHGNGIATAWTEIPDGAVVPPDGAADGGTDNGSVATLDGGIPSSAAATGSCGCVVLPRPRNSPWPYALAVVFTAVSMARRRSPRTDSSHGQAKTTGHSVG